MNNLPRSNDLSTTKIIPRTVRMSLEVACAFFDTWATSFASSPSFYKIANRPVLSVLGTREMVNLYGLDGLRVLLWLGRSRVRDHLGVEPYLLDVFDRADMANVRLVNQLPFDGATGYALLPDWDGPLTQDYAELMSKRVQEWYIVQSHMNIPFFPVVCAGWDATVRGVPVDNIQEMRGFPWKPVIVGLTAELFGHFIDEAILFNSRCHPELPIVFLHAWNEWTEGSSIEPSDRFGTAFLDEIRMRSHLFNAADLKQNPKKEGENDFSQ